MLQARSNRDKDYSREELIRAAWMAGNGATAGEIAEVLNTTPSGVYRLFRRLGLFLVDKHEEEEIVQLRILRQHSDMAGRLAAQKNVDPRRFLSRLLRAVLSDKELTGKVVERAFK
jgi:hypothetical protein